MLSILSKNQRGKNMALPKKDTKKELLQEIIEEPVVVEEVQPEPVFLQEIKEPNHEEKSSKRRSRKKSFGIL